MRILPGSLSPGGCSNMMTRLVHQWTSHLAPQLFTLSRSFSSQSSPDQYDVVVVGGGLVGAALACALDESFALGRAISSRKSIAKLSPSFDDVVNKNLDTPASGNLLRKIPHGLGICYAAGSSPMTSKLRVAVVDGQTINPAAPLPPPSEVPDIRVSAVTPASVKLFRDVGAWATVQSARHAPFDTMQVWDSAGQGFVRYSSHDVGAPVLGHVVENRVLLAALHHRLRDSENTHLVCPAKVDSITWPEIEQSGTKANARQRTDGQAEMSSEDGGKEGGFANVHLSNGKVLGTRLVVGADGGRSRVRSLAGLRTMGWQYDQRGLVATVMTDYEHTTAWQRFLPTGPLALLPMGGLYSNIVWSTSESHARALESMPPPDFAAAVNRALSQEHAPQPPSSASSFLPNLPFLGGSSAGGFEPPPRVVEAVGKRASFPLSLVHSGKYVQPRLALIGDAAHSVHPLAGQGVNLGFGDARALAAVIARGVATGRDIGDLDLLEGYQAERRAANLGMMAALDGLQRLFHAQATPVALARNLGLDLVQWLTPVKKRIMSYAMGLEPVQ